MAPLFFLSICSLILSWAGYKFINFYVILTFGMSAGIVWEYITPLINPKSTTDPFDLICYFIGTVNYYMLIKFFNKVK